MKSSGLKKYLPAIFLLALWVAASGELRAATKLDNRMLGSLLQIATALERNGRQDEAIQALMPHREDARILRRLSDLYRKSGRPGEFLPLIEQAYSREADDELLLKIYLQALGTAELSDSLRNAGLRFIARSPKEELRYQLVAQEFRNSGYPEDALRLYLEGRKALSQPLSFRRESAEVLIDLKRYDQALDEMLSYLESNPNELPVVQRLAYRFLDQGEQASSLLVGRLEKAVSSASPGRFRNAMISLSLDIDLTQGRSDRAFDSLTKLLETLDARLARARLASFITRSLKLKNYPLALAGYSLADSLSLIGRGETLLAKANIRLKMGETSKAETDLLELATNGRAGKLRAKAIKQLGRIYLDQLNRPADALYWFRELEKIDGDKNLDLVEIKLQIAESFIHLGELDKAMSLCNNLLGSGTRKHENLAGILLVKADVHFYRGETDSAASAYSRFAKLLIGEPEANDAIERVYLIQNDKSPEDIISAGVGKALHQALRGNLQGATELFQETLQSVTDSVYRAQVYYQMGRMYESAAEFPLALGVYGEIVQLFPDHHLAPLAELRMGLVLIDEVGDEKGARSHLERIVFEYPECVVTPLARHLLRTLEKDAL
ncbi:hypothetical protein ACFL4P_00790 [Gemmatimonadota bacterium]